MTNLAENVASKTIGNPRISSLAAADLLEISGTAPQTVYVKDLGIIDGQRRVGFGASPEGDFHSHGIEWATTPDDHEYAKFITCVFVSPTLVEITCPTLHYSAVNIPKPDVQTPSKNQNMCVPWGGAIYAFNVEVLLESGDHAVIVDPIIVVSPITAKPAGDGHNGKA